MTDNDSYGDSDDDSDAVLNAVWAHPGVDAPEDVRVFMRGGNVYATDKICGHRYAGKYQFHRELHAVPANNCNSAYDLSADQEPDDEEDRKIAVMANRLRTRRSGLRIRVL